MHYVFFEKSNKARAYGDAILDASGLALIKSPLFSIIN
jgi:hypothetical protein